MHLYAASFVFEHVFHTAIAAKFQTSLRLCILKHPVTRQLGCHGVNHGLSGKGGMTLNAMERDLVVQGFRFSSFYAVPGVLSSQ